MEKNNKEKITCALQEIESNCGQVINKYEKFGFKIAEEDDHWRFWVENKTSVI